VSKFQHYTKLCRKASISPLSYLNLSPICGVTSRNFHCVRTLYLLLSYDTHNKCRLFFQTALKDRSL
jgi:hypothetical protein